MTEMITKLMEVSRNAFGAWRENEGVWSMRQFESLSKLLGNKIMLGDAPPELFEVKKTDTRKPPKAKWIYLDFDPSK